MSNWTHVASIIRVDNSFPYEVDLDFTKIIGKELHYNDSIEKCKDARNNPNSYLPMGSEGSLYMSVWTNPDKSCIAKYTVSIFGDLRDHNDVSGVIKWFQDICIKLNTIDDIINIRNAMIVVDNEILGIESWIYNGSEFNN